MLRLKTVVTGPNVFRKADIDKVRYPIGYV